MGEPRPPTRDRTLPADPWAEQTARREVSTRRRRRIGGALALVMLLLVAAAWLLGRNENTSTRANPVATASPTISSSTTRATEVEPTPTPGGGITSGRASGDVLVPVEIDEVWLLDRGDGTYGWGVVIVSRLPDGAVPVSIQGRLVDASGGEAAVVEERVGSLAPGASAVVGGVVDDPVDVPRRLEVDIAVGDPLADPAPHPEDLQILAIERRGEGDADGLDDVVVGRLRSTTTSDLVGVGLALIWRDDNSRVVRALFHDVERVRSGVDARFEVPVDDTLPIGGPPNEVHWTH